MEGKMPNRMINAASNMSPVVKLLVMGSVSGHPSLKYMAWITRK
jgi:hypothetical protein